jgi:hypothetical protein
MATATTAVAVTTVTVTMTMTVLQRGRAAKISEGAKLQQRRLFNTKKVMTPTAMTPTAMIPTAMIPTAMTPTATISTVMTPAVTRAMNPTARARAHGGSIPLAVGNPTVRVHPWRMRNGGLPLVK